MEFQSLGLALIGCVALMIAVRAQRPAISRRAAIVTIATLVGMFVLGGTAAPAEASYWTTGVLAYRAHPPQVNWVGAIGLGMLMLGGFGSYLSYTRLRRAAPTLFRAYVMGALLLVVGTGCAAKQIPPPTLEPVAPAVRQNCDMKNIPVFEKRVTDAEAKYELIKERAEALQRQVLEVDNPALEAKIAELEGALGSLPVPQADLDERGVVRNKEEMDTYQVAKSTLERDIASARLQIALNLKKVRDIEAKRDELYAALEAAKKNLTEENECLARKADELARQTNQQEGEATKAPPLQ